MCIAVCALVRFTLARIHAPMLISNRSCRMWRQHWIRRTCLWGRNLSAIWTKFTMLWANISWRTCCVSILPTACPPRSAPLHECDDRNTDDSGVECFVGLELWNCGRKQKNLPCKRTVFSQDVDCWAPLVLGQVIPFRADLLIPHHHCRMWHYMPRK